MKEGKGRRRKRSIGDPRVHAHPTAPPGTAPNEKEPRPGRGSTRRVGRRVPSAGQRRPALPRASPAVPSALGGLASGFGMGPGVPRPPWPLARGRRSARGRGLRRALRAAWRVGRVPGRIFFGMGAAPSCGTGDAPAPARVRRVRARAISTARLNGSPRLHLRPIDQVVYLGPYQRENLSRERLPA